MNTCAIFSAISRSLKKRIVSSEFFDDYHIGKAFSRSRKLSFQNLVYFVLNSTHKSLAINYAHLGDVMPMRLLPDVTKQAN